MPFFRHPVIYHNSNAGQDINRKAILHYLLPVLLISIVATSPRFFEAQIDVEHQVHNVTDPETKEIVSSQLTTVHKLGYSPIRFHYLYVLCYLNIFRLLFFGIGPFFLLVYFNYHIVKVIKRRGNVQTQQNADVKTAVTRQCKVSHGILESIENYISAVGRNDQIAWLLLQNQDSIINTSMNPKYIIRTMYRNQFLPTCCSRLTKNL